MVGGEADGRTGKNRACRTIDWQVYGLVAQTTTPLILWTNALCYENPTRDALIRDASVLPLSGRPWWRYPGRGDRLWGCPVQNPPSLITLPAA